MSPYLEFAAAARKFSSSPFFCLTSQAASSYGVEPHELTYAEAFDRVADLQVAYRNRSYGLGHRIGLLLENRPEFFFHFLALNGLGVSVLPIDAALPVGDIAYQIGHSDACALVCLPGVAARATQAVELSGSKAPVVATDRFPKLPAAPTPSRAEAASPATEAALLYTSGTTGQPKGCMISNEYFIGLGHWYLNEGGYCTLEPGRERLITPLPVNHMNSLACSTMAMIMAGGCIVQLDRFHPSTWWQSVRESRSTIVHYLGVMPAMLLNLPTHPDDGFWEQIKFGFGAGVDVRHHRAFEQRFGFPLIEAWAMTETGAGACISASHEPRHVGTRCFGKAPPALEYRLVDESGNETPEGQPGELLVRAAGERPERNFFSGYYKDKAATADAWSGGWFHTGDVVRIDGEGSFYFVDRRKNIIRRSGENIAALEVEATLLQQAAVHNCAVAPVPDEIRGEEVMACIVLAPETDPTMATADAIVRFTIDALVYFKAPGYVAFVEHLPMTASQKIQRGEVKRLCVELLENGACFDLREQKRRRKPETRSA